MIFFQLVPVKAAAFLHSFFFLFLHLLLSKMFCGTLLTIKVESPACFEGLFSFLELPAAFFLMIWKQRKCEERKKGEEKKKGDSILIMRRRSKGGRSGSLRKLLEVPRDHKRQKGKAITNSSSKF